MSSWMPASSSTAKDVNENTFLSILYDKFACAYDQKTLLITIQKGR